MLRLLPMIALFASFAIAAEQTPDVYTWDPQLIARARERVLAGDESLQPALARLRRDADKELAGELAKVTDKLDHLAQTVGGKHTYASISPYFWPQDAKPDAPWVMRDGERNVEMINQFDGPRMGAMTRRVITCSLAYYFTGEKKYAARAADQLRAWFIDTETRMNPDMEYAQCVPNKSRGEPWGIIDANQFPYLLDSVMLLSDSGHWSDEDHKVLQNWFGQFTEWLLTSDLAKREAAAANNHGTFFDLLLARSAIFCGKTDVARNVAQAFGPSRIAKQIEPDGSTPHEQKRVNSAMYTSWNLKGMADMMLLARRLEIDLWNYQGPENQSIRHAALWLMPYVQNPATWTFGDGKFSKTSPAEFYRILAATTRDPEITTFCRTHIHPESDADWQATRLVLLFPME